MSTKEKTVSVELTKNEAMFLAYFFGWHSTSDGTNNASYRLYQKFSDTAKDHGVAMLNVDYSLSFDVVNMEPLIIDFKPNKDGFILTKVHYSR